MVSKYDTLIIINPKIGEEKIKETEQKIRTFLEKNAANIFNFESMGVQRLATPIKKKNNGYYLLIQYEIDGEKVKEFTQQLKITEPVLRYMHVNLESIVGKEAAATFGEAAVVETA